VSASSIAKDPYRPGYEAIAEKITEFIAREGLNPGDRLPTEYHLGELLGVKRAMVREAIKLLSARGYVRAKRGSGLFVGDGAPPQAQAAINLSMPVDHEHMLSLFEFRCMIEMLTARLAAERITPAELRILDNAVERNIQGAEQEQWDAFIEADVDFHQGIANASHNPFLAETASTFRLQRWAIRIITGGAPGSWLRSAEQHAAILAAIKAGQPEEAARAMQAHVQTVITEYQHATWKLLTEHPVSVPSSGS
jgi:GntR family transcriptional regulator, transcriptional repressor for pyruvate dehydrogenase complex